MKKLVLFFLILCCNQVSAQEANLLVDTVSNKPLAIYSIDKANEFKINYKSGFYKNALAIKISGVDPNKVHVILSNESGETYPGLSFNITETSSLSVIIKDDKGQEKKYLGTYFINSPHQLPIVSIIVDSIEFFPPEGIYYGEVANREEKKKNKKAKTKVVGKAWDKKPISCFAQFFFYENLIDQLALDVKTYGGMTLGWKEKSLQLSARSNKYEKGKIKVKLFEHLPFREYQHVVLRTSGNDQHSTRIKDISISQVASDINLNTKDFRQVVLYVNGIYYGIHNLREKINSDYFKYRYNWKKGDFVELQGSGDESAEYTNFVNYLTECSDKPDFINLVKDSIDIENYFNYQIFETYITNIDSRGNVRFYKHKDGKWKWVVYDADQACAFAETNFIKNRTLPSERLWYNPSYTTTIMEHLLKNDTLRGKFITQYCYLNATYLNAGYFHSSLDQRAIKIKDELPRHFNRRKNLYKEDLEFWTENLAELKHYFIARDSNLIDDLRNTFSLDTAFHLTVNQNINLFNGLTVNNSIVTTKSINGFFFKSIPFELNAIEKNHLYSFDKWSDNSSESTKRIQLDNDIVLTAYFKHKPSSSLCRKIEINKCYVSFSKKDPLFFVELYNSSNDTLKLTGFKLYEDNLDLSHDLSDVVLLPLSSVFLVSNEKVFRENTTLKKSKIYPLFNDKYVNDNLRIAIIDTIKNQWLDSLQFIINDSMLVVHSAYMIQKAGGKLSVKNLSISKLKQFKLENDVVHTSEFPNLNYIVIVFAIAIVLILILIIMLRKRKNKINNLIILIILLASTSCNAQNTNSVKEEKIESVKSNCETKKSILKRSIDNLGRGDSSFLGTRNFRAVFPGILYRGGGNNLDLKDSIPKYYVQNPLPYYAIKNLHDAGFGKVYYLYSKNFEARYSKEAIDSIRTSGLNYLCRPSISDSFLIEFYSDLLSRINNDVDDEKERVYIHCWNGWHQSGMLSALSLMQFCDFNSTQALKYWELCTENNYKGYNNVRTRIKEYTRLKQFSFTEIQKKKFCPCMTELDTAHVGKPIIVSKDSLTLSNKEMMEKPISGHGKYIVKEGDNLYNISLKIGIDVAELKRKNRLRSNLIHVGDTLVY